MSVGLKIVAAAANHRPIDIKGLVEQALFERANQVFEEGFKIVSERVYGLGEAITPMGSGSITRSGNKITMKTKDASGKTSTKTKTVKEDELEEGRKKLSKGTKDFNKPFNALHEPNRKMRKAQKGTKKETPQKRYLAAKHETRRVNRLLPKETPAE